MVIALKATYPSVVHGFIKSQTAYLFLSIIFSKLPQAESQLFTRKLKGPKLVNESDSFAFVFPSFALFLQQEVGDEVANLQAITEAESLWLGYSNCNQVTVYDLSQAMSDLLR